VGLVEGVGRVFERFTERARKVVVLAQEEARHFNHNYIGTEHLLLGLLREDEGTVTARALASVNVTLRGAREQLESIVGHGEEDPGSQMPFTPRSKKVLELALREAIQLDHNYIGSEHILLGLVRENEGVASQMLSSMGVEADELHTQVIRMLGADPPQRRRGLGARLLGGGRAARPEPQSFRGRVDFEVQARCVDRTRQSPQTILVELDYVYPAQKAEHDFSEPVDHGDLRRGLASIFEEGTFPIVEASIARAEDYIRDEFPAIQEATVSVTMRQEPRVTVARTFRR
jgi:dihydroneopterin aldolase